MTIFERLIERGCIDEKSRISWEIVDVDFRKFQKHAMNRRLCRILSQIKCRRQDILEWISEKKSFSAGYDFVLMCRMLNNLSDYTISRTASMDEISRIAGRKICEDRWINHEFFPHTAIMRRCHKNLMVMNTSIRTREGSIFQQISLSPYFQAIHEACGFSKSVSEESCSLFYPVRSISEASLTLPDGRSIFEQLCSIAGCVIVEDIDLDAMVVRNHMRNMGLRQLVATDLTRQRRLATSHLICIAEKSSEKFLPGVRIW